MDLQSSIEMGYIVAAVLFIFGLKMLGSARTAKRGNLVSAVGMLIAVIASLVTAGFYFHVIWVMFGPNPNDETALVSPGIGTQIVIWVGVAGTLLLGVLPGPLLDIAINSAGFIR